MSTDPTSRTSQSGPGDAVPRSILKRAWRLVFWPFYRHFDVLHMEIESLKAGQQSTRILCEQQLQHAQNALEHSRRPSEENSADLRRMEIRISQLESRVQSALAQSGGTNAGADRTDTGQRRGSGSDSASRGKKP